MRQQTPTIKKRIFKTSALAAGFGVAYYALGVLSVIRQVKRYRSQWDSLAQTTGDVLYVALGDSTAQGIGASKREDSYVHQLSERLSTKTAKSIRTCNFSVTGATTQDLIEKQLPKLTELKPDILTLSIGSNDIVRNVPLATILHNMQTILKTIPEGSFIATLPPFTGPLAKKSKQVNQRIGDCALMYGHHVVDIHAVYLKQGTNLRYFGRDFFHPSTKAYAQWTEVFWETMAMHLKHTSNS